MASEKKLAQHGSGKPKLSASHRPEMGYKFFGLDPVPLRDAKMNNRQSGEKESVLEWWRANFPHVQLKRESFARRWPPSAPGGA